MRLRQKWILIFSIVFSSIFNGQQIFAQTYEQSLQYANEQYNLKNYDNALKTYKRLLFFAENKDRFPLYEKIGELSLNTKNYYDAATFYNLAYKNTSNSDTKADFLLKKAYSEMMVGDFLYATMDLLNIQTENQYLQKQINFYLGTCYFGLEKFDKAETYFLKCVDNKEKETIKKLFKSKKLYRPNPRTAKILSMIIPGAGQFYVGDFKEGAKSLLLSAGMITMMVISAINIDFLTGTLAIIPWFQRYYTGGFQKAKSLAIIKRQKNRSKIYNQIVKIVEKNANN